MPYPVVDMDIVEFAKNNIEYKELPMVSTTTVVYLDMMSCGGNDVTSLYVLLLGKCKTCFLVLCVESLDLTWRCRHPTCVRYPRAAIGDKLRASVLFCVGGVFNS